MKNSDLLKNVLLRNQLVTIIGGLEEPTKYCDSDCKDNSDCSGSDTCEKFKASKGCPNEYVYTCMPSLV
ncbi:hypothetical protein ACG2LH_09275 [Zhouia sp. PK063]